MRGRPDRASAFIETDKISTENLALYTRRRTFHSAFWSASFPEIPRIPRIPAKVRRTFREIYDDSFVTKNRIQRPSVSGESRGDSPGRCVRTNTICGIAIVQPLVSFPTTRRRLRLHKRESRRLFPPPYVFRSSRALVRASCMRVHLIELCRRCALFTFCSAYRLWA